MQKALLYSQERYGMCHIRYRFFVMIYLWAVRSQGICVGLQDIEKDPPTEVPMCYTYKFLLSDQCNVSRKSHLSFCQVNSLCCLQLAYYHHLLEIAVPNTPYQDLSHTEGLKHQAVVAYLNSAVKSISNLLDANQYRWVDLSTIFSAG